LADNKKISELPAASTPLGGSEEVEILQGGVNKRVSVSNFGTGDVPTLADVLAAGNSAGLVITDGIDPTNAQDLATKNYVDIVAGADRSWKDPVSLATTASITLSGEQTIDGVLTSASRVLVKNQSTPSQNGIYVSAAGAWTRATDLDVSAEFNGAATVVLLGSTNAAKQYQQTTVNPTVGSSSIVWQQIGTSASVPDGSTTVKGVFEEGDDAEAIAGTGTGGTGARLVVSPPRLAAWWTDAKGKAQTWALKQTFTTAPRLSSVTALDVLAVDSSKDLIGKSFATLASDLGVPDFSLTAVAISAGTLTLAWGSANNKTFDLTTTVSSNFTIAFTGSNNLRGELFMRVTGTIVITMPAAVIADLYEGSVGRWSSGSDQLTITGVTASPFYFTFRKDASGNVWVHVTNRGV
jgi:hypothetical protein